MLNRYEKFLEEFDKRLYKYFNEHKEYIKCHKRCSDCCEVGEYPFSRLEAEYIISGFIKLNPNIQKQIKENIKLIIKQKQQNHSERFTYRCPFLLDGLCTLYKYRGIVCRTFGLAYIDNNMVRLPECINIGLNYSEIYDRNKKEIKLPNPIKENLRIDSVLRSKASEKYELECGKIQPLIEWFL